MLPSDNCVYKRDTSQGKIILAIHVDDVLVAATTKSMIDDFNQEISKTFEISTNNPLTSILACLLIVIANLKRSNYHNQGIYLKC